jgi:hypothetical protein
MNAEIAKVLEAMEANEHRVTEGKWQEAVDVYLKISDYLRQLLQAGSSNHTRACDEKLY